MVANKLLVIVVDLLRKKHPGLARLLKSNQNIIWPRYNFFSRQCDKYKTGFILLLFLGCLYHFVFICLFKKDGTRQKWINV
jgi:hypothetical protein